LRRRRLFLPLTFSIILFGAYFVLRDRPIVVRRIGDIREALFGHDLRLLLFAAIAALIFLVVRILDSFFFDFVFSRRQRAAAPILLREIVSLAMFLILFGWSITAIFGTRWTGFVATGTVLAAVLGFALQDTLGNLFAGIALTMERTFEVGDVIRCGEFTGMIEGVSWRATRIRTVNNNLVVLPNSVIARERIEMFPAQNLNARVVAVRVSYDAQPSQVISVLEQAAQNVEGVAQEIPCLARVAAFGDFGLQYEVKYWTRAFQSRENIDAALRKAIWYALKRNNLTIPFPIRTVHRLSPQRPETGIGEGEIARRLHDVDVLAPLSEEEQNSIKAGARVRRYSQGETILRFGQPGQSMFVVHEGRVSIRIPLDGRPSGEVAQMGVGSIFGEMALLTGESRSADVVAITDVTVLEIGKECLEPILKNNPALAATIANKVAERRNQLASSRTQMSTDEHRTLLRTIRSYFGLS
jgi:small-conductance mechanosensitive channel/CRP-like cAMP-binding protein